LADQQGFGDGGLDRRGDLQAEARARLYGDPQGVDPEVHLDEGDHLAVALQDLVDGLQRCRISTSLRRFSPGMNMMKSARRWPLASRLGRRCHRGSMGSKEQARRSPGSARAGNGSANDSIALLAGTGTGILGFCAMRAS
jgi:hypothetical protein